MKPLQAIAFGVLLLALDTTSPDPGAFDPLPDPLGWLFLLLGLYGLTRAGDVVEPGRRGVLRLLGVLALVISVVLVVPDAARWLADQDEPALGWAVDLPRFTFLLLLCEQLGRRAHAAAARVPATTFGLLTAAFAFVLAAPPLAFGAGLTGVGQAGQASAQAAQLALVVTCLAVGGRRWAGAPDPSDAPDPR